MPLPDSIANAPFLLLGLELYLIAFMELTSERNHSQGIEGPIGWLKIKAYCNCLELCEEQETDLFYFIQNMDAKYLEYKASKNKPAK